MPVQAALESPEGLLYLVPVLAFSFVDLLIIFLLAYFFHVLSVSQSKDPLLL